MARIHGQAVQCLDFVKVSRRLIGYSLKMSYLRKPKVRATLPDRRIIGRIQVVTAAVGYGLLGIFGKRAYEAGMHPGELLALRFLLASVVLWSYMLVAKRGAVRITFRQAVYCAALGVLGYAFFSTLYSEALDGM